MQEDLGATHFTSSLFATLTPQGAAHTPSDRRSLPQIAPGFDARTGCERASAGDFGDWTLRLDALRPRTLR